MSSKSFYIPSVPGGPLRQGELFSEVFEFVPEYGSPMDAEQIGVRVSRHELVILLSQDCDLDIDYLNRERLKKTEEEEKKKRLQSKILRNALFCEMEPAKIFEEGLTQGESWDRIYKNNDFRFHYLEGLPASCDLSGEGCSSMVVIFKRYFCVSMDDLLVRLDRKETRRRCSLESPYFEHVSDRFGHYIARVGLPRDHK